MQTSVYVILHYVHVSTIALASQCRRYSRLLFSSSCQ